jgi:hypothetical protein
MQDGAAGGEGEPNRGEDNGAGADQPEMASSLPQVFATPLRMAVSGSSIASG